MLAPFPFSLIVAMANHNCIGRNNDLPWHVPEDLKRFKTLTLEKPVVMGRKTFESILARLGKPLPKRKTLLISGSGYQYDGVDCENVITYTSLKELINSVPHDFPNDEIMIAGGASIYAQALPFVGKLYLTFIDTNVENGDAFFPTLDPKEWTISASETFSGEPNYRFETWVRKFIP
jgi:dihydrofolate reductase